MVRHWTERTAHVRIRGKKTVAVSQSNAQSQSSRASRATEKARERWPQLLSRDQAVSYVGLPERVFDEHIRPLLTVRRFGKAIYFYRPAIDKVLDRFWASPDPADASVREFLDRRQRKKEADLQRQEDEMLRIIDEM